MQRTACNHFADNMLAEQEYGQEHSIARKLSSLTANYKYL